MRQKKLFPNHITFLIFLFFNPFICNNLFGQEIVRNINIEKISTYIEKSMKEWKIPGMAVAIVHNDSVILSKGYGIRHCVNGGKIDENTLFGIASLTKTFTASALGTLVDREKISWEDKVSDYIPYFQLYDPYVSDEMQIRDLLCHRSGLKTFSGDLIWYASNYNSEEVIKRAKYLEPEYGFRTHFGYSNIMFLAAGKIIEEVTDTAWADYIKTYLFEPLNMTISNTSITEFGENENIVYGHYTNEDTIIAEPYVNWDNMAPAGAINSNINELSHWIMLHCNYGKYAGSEILSKDVCWEMYSPQTIINVNEWESKYWPSRHFNTYGLGWNVFDYHSKKVISHSGGLEGQVSELMIIPEEKFGFVILTNSVSSLPMALSYYIMDSYFTGSSTDWSSFYFNAFTYNNSLKKEKEREAEESRAKNTTPTLNLEKYTGLYGGKMYGNASVVLENNALIVKFLPTPLFVGELTHLENDTFRIQLRNTPSLPKGTVRFIINEQEKVEEMKIDIPNPDFDFTELKFKRLE